MPIRVALHMHTHYSHDSNWSPSGMLAAAEREGIDCIAVTDHDSLTGALEARRLSRRVRVIVGEEVSSADGHILGLFLREWIEPGLSGEQTIARIHAQGGLAIAPHPYATLCAESLGRDALERLGPRFDAIEIHNAQNVLPWEDLRAASYARRRNLPGCVGCDSHVRGRLAPAWQEMPDFGCPRSFLHALRLARPVFGRHSIAAFGWMALRHFWDKASSRPLPGFGQGLARQRGGRFALD